ncbi:hypothetical protein L6164_036970 [Bauhinia variegata]|uniref:Uncharacterized protein n=1 Tax=Bauhinia variegata TaxID=167791 RepID=A0ACB9KIT1_BAUVA|nr:hypothetical protein L6164_036970 [Bauhinia variegata]
MGCCQWLIVLASISIIAVSQIFFQLRCYHILVAYPIAPFLAFCNALHLTGYSTMVVRGVEGVSSLPRNCLLLAAIFFFCCCWDLGLTS